MKPAYRKYRARPFSRQIHRLSASSPMMTIGVWKRIVNCPWSPMARRPWPALRLRRGCGARSGRVPAPSAQRYAQPRSRTAQADGCCDGDLHGAQNGEITPVEGAHRFDKKIGDVRFRHARRNGRSAWLDVGEGPAARRRSRPGCHLARLTDAAIPHRVGHHDGETCFSSHSRNCQRGSAPEPMIGMRVRWPTI